MKSKRRVVLVERAVWPGIRKCSMTILQHTIKTRLGFLKHKRKQLKGMHVMVRVCVLRMYEKWHVLTWDRRWSLSHYIYQHFYNPLNKDHDMKNCPVKEFFICSTDLIFGLTSWNWCFRFDQDTLFSGTWTIQWCKHLFVHLVFMCRSFTKRSHESLENF